MATFSEYKKIISNNDDEERDILEQFLLRLNLKYEELNKTEKPDFIIEFDGKKFGFEITKYYSDKTKKGSKSFKFLNNWISFMQELRNVLNKQDEKYKYYYGAIFFKNELNSIDNLDKNKFLEEFCISIKNINLENGEKRTIQNNELNSEYLSEIIEHIYMENKFPFKNPMWWLSSLQTGTVNIDYNRLNNIIEEKERKSVNYNKNLDGKYLLIYATGLGLNDIIIINDDHSVSKVQRQGPIMLYELSEDNSNIISKSNIEINISINYFDKIYTFDHFTETIWEIYPQIRQVFDYGKKTIWVNRLPMKMN